MAALDRAVALAEGDDRAVGVREQLDLDVARTLDVALAEDGAVAERGLRLAAGRLERLLELLRRAHDPHAAAAAARGRLDEQREAELVGLAGLDDGDAGLAREPLRRELVAARAQRLDGRADPDEAGRLDRGGEVGALREEPVAGMDRVGARLLRRAHVLLRLQVRGDLDRRVRLARVQGAAVVGRGDGDRRDPELAAAAEDPAGDLAAVGYEESADRHRPASVSAQTAARAR